jgi:hypothetical protein
MARSAYIWVVFDEMTEDVVAAFTVKHELVTWLTRVEPPIRRWYAITRMRDGGAAHRAHFTMTELGVS